MTYLGFGRDFFGLKTFTPFEEVLIKELSDRLSGHNRLALESQVKRFNYCPRLLKADPSVVGLYGYTNFYLGKNKTDYLPFKMDEPLDVIASAVVVFNEGEIKVSYTQFKKRLFTLKYTGNKKSYYPPKGKYKFSEFKVFL